MDGSEAGVVVVRCGHFRSGAQFPTGSAIGVGNRGGRAPLAGPFSICS
jgi:hypothetical protein